MKFPVWPLRILILIYFFYKMFLSDPSGPFTGLFEFEGKSAGRIAGETLAYLLFFATFGLFYFYQISQGLIEMKGGTEIKKIRFRMFSIVFSIIFFFLFGLSLINVNFPEIEIVSYLIELYTLFTLIAIIASIKVIVTDIKLYRAARQVKITNPNY